MTEVAGVPELGAIGRGEDMDITTYLEQAMTSELQARRRSLPGRRDHLEPYAFAARPWRSTNPELIRRDGRARLGQPHRHPRPRGDAYPAARRR